MLLSGGVRRELVISISEDQTHTYPFNRNCRYEKTYVNVTDRLCHEELMVSLLSGIGVRA